MQVNEEIEEIQIKEQNEWRARVTKLFKKDPVTNRRDLKLLFVAQCSTAGLFAGFLIGGRIGSRIGAVEHIEGHQLALYDNPTQAQRVYHGKVFLGALRNGLRFGWRCALLAGFYSLSVVVTNEINPDNIGQNYLVSGTASGVFYNIFRGWRSMLVGGILGGGLTAPISGLIGLASIYFPEKRNRFLYSNYMLGFDQSAEEVAEEEEEPIEIVDYFKAYSEVVEDTLKETDET